MPSSPDKRINSLKKQYGLIGYPLSHSFSRKYFSEKFEREHIIDCEYTLFEINKIELVEEVFQKENLQGFNVTIPYKHEIMKYMDDFDHSAKKVGAVNVVKINSSGKRIGFNSDYYGFRASLEKWLPNEKKFRALILGAGGAAKAVIEVLNDLSIPFLIISRNKNKGDFTYLELKSDPEILMSHELIINTTPLGMSPKIDEKPEIDYGLLTADFYLYDLIYNPPTTKFMAEGQKWGAKTKNGMEMLELQAEKSWEIWNS